MTSKNAFLTLTAVLAATAGTTAAFAAGTDTTITVADVPALKAGDRAPFDVPGVRAIRRGKTIPAGYVLPGQRVTIDQGLKAAGAALIFRCPDAKRLRSFATTGAAGFSATRDYVGRRQTQVMSLGRDDSEGVVYAVCR